VPIAAILDAAPFGVVAVGRDGRVSLWSSLAESLLGWPAAEVVGQPLPSSWSALAEPTSEPAHVSLLRRDGSLAGVSLTVAVLYGPDGDPAGTAAYLAPSGAAREVEGLWLLRPPADERRQLLARLVLAQEEERERLASEVHDDAVQVLTAVGLRLAAVRRGVEDERQRQFLDELDSSVRTATRRLHRLLGELRLPHALGRGGIATALRARLTALELDAGIATRFDDRLLVCEPSPEVATLVLRLLQQTLAGVRRRATASRVAISLETRGEGVYASLVSDGSGAGRAGSGFDPAEWRALAVLREQADLAGGWLRIEHGGSSGTIVELWLPDAVAVPPAASREGDAA
jgi:signal transduction histidine kinase